MSKGWGTTIHAELQFQTQKCESSRQFEKFELRKNQIIYIRWRNYCPKNLRVLKHIKKKKSAPEEFEIFENEANFRYTSATKANFYP